jgi:signal transduction histidine kinase
MSFVAVRKRWGPHGHAARHALRYNRAAVGFSATSVWAGTAMEEWERLLNELRAELILREQELDLLHNIDIKLLDPGQSPDDILNFTVQGTKKLLQANHTTILYRRSKFLEPMYSNMKSVVGQRVPIAQSLTGWCLEQDCTVNVADLTTDPLGKLYAPLRGYRGPRMLSLLATPIRIRGTTVGVLNAESKTTNAFKPVHERMAVAVASQVAMALEQTQALASTALFQDLDRLVLASEDSQNVVEHSKHVIQIALETVMAELTRLEHVKHSEAQILFLQGQDVLEVVHSTNPSHIGLTVPVARSVSGEAVIQAKTRVYGDEVLHLPHYQGMFGESIRSEIAVPILFGKNDIVIGVLNVESSEPDAFSGFYQIILESFAAKVRTLLAFAKLRADVTEALDLRSADDLLAAVGDQAAHMVHRLNNTVGAMRLRIMELQRKQRRGTLDEQFLQDALQALHELAELTLQMPDDITAMLGQKGSMVDMNDCVKRAVKEIQIPESVTLNLDLDSKIPALPLYRFDIVVQNLLKNSIDAMPDGGSLSVSTAAVPGPAKSRGYFRLTIKDSGSGIPRDVQRRIFELNFSTKRERGEGLGLGLWWVRHFVKRARGDISVKSEVGSGTEVTVKIPLDPSGRL